jgi:AcrR family transcriptional regulator
MPTSRPRVRPRRPRRDAAASRARILEAAAAEFAERGFAAAGVDRIARRARLNKAMIYYHFPSKAALYQEILREMFRAVGDRIRALAASARPPEEKVREFPAIIAGEAQQRPHFAAIMLRELAEKGRHLDHETLGALALVPATFHQIVRDGQREGRLGNADPLLTYFAMMGPLMLFVGSAPLRAQLARLGVPALQEVTLQALVAHLQEISGWLRRGGGRRQKGKGSVADGDTRS